MSLSNKNQFESLRYRPWNPNGTKTVLVSGCGISWSGQESKTWVNLLSLSGLKIYDVGGPAVSNSWILNRAIDYITNNTVDYAVIQLTSLNKLDVEINDERFNELVANDTLRSFTIDGIWPSSASIEHESKLQWHKWLSSPNLELLDIEGKLKLLKFYCQEKKIPLLVLAGYNIFAENQDRFCDLVYNVNMSLYDSYQQSEFHEQHKLTSPVPALPFQIEILKTVNENLNLRIDKLINRLEQQYE